MPICDPYGNPLMYVSDEILERLLDDGYVYYDRGVEEYLLGYKTWIVGFPPPQYGIMDVMNAVIKYSREKVSCV